jgi:diaminopimelate decarboxylase
VGEGVLKARPAAASPGRLLDLFAEAGLTRQNGTLACSGVALNDVAEATGTPVFAYNADAIRSRYRTLDESLAPVPHRICFAVKANSNLAVLRIMRDLGAGADIVSLGELARARAAGFSPDRIVFSGVGKTAEEIRAAVKSGVGHLNVESREELELLGRIALAEDTEVQVGIRVNPDVTTDTHPYISTGKSGIKFGVPTDQVVPAAEYVLRHRKLRLTTLAMHLGSQLVTTEPFVEGIGRILELIDRVKRVGVNTLGDINNACVLGIT